MQYRTDILNLSQKIKDIQSCNDILELNSEPENIESRSNISLSILTHNLSWELLSATQSIGTYTNFDQKYKNPYISQSENSKLAMDDMYSFLNNVMVDKNIQVLLLQEITDPFINLLKEHLGDLFGFATHQNGPAICAIIYNKAAFNNENPQIYGAAMHNGRPICIAIFHSIKMVLISCHDKPSNDFPALTRIISEVFNSVGVDNSYTIVLGGDFNSAIKPEGIKINNIVLKEPQNNLKSCCIMVHPNDIMYQEADHILCNREIINYGMIESKLEDIRLSDHNLIYANI
jgi:hypothetical protein